MNFIKNINKELEELKMLDLTSIKRDNILPSSNHEKFSNNLGKIEQDPFIGYIGKNYYQNNMIEITDLGDISFYDYIKNKYYRNE